MRIALQSSRLALITAPVAAIFKTDLAAPTRPLCTPSRSLAMELCWFFAFVKVIALKNFEGSEAGLNLRRHALQCAACSGTTLADARTSECPSEFLEPHTKRPP